MRNGDGIPQTALGALVVLSVRALVTATFALLLPSCAAQDGKGDEAMGAPWTGSDGGMSKYEALCFDYCRSRANCDSFVVPEGCRLECFDAVHTWAQCNVAFSRAALCLSATRACPKSSAFPKQCSDNQRDYQTCLLSDAGTVQP